MIDGWSENIRGIGGKDHSPLNEFILASTAHGRTSRKQIVNTVDWSKIPRKSNMSFHKEVGQNQTDIK